MTDHAQDAPLTDPGCLGVSANTMCCAVLYRDGSSGGANHRVLWRRWKTESGFKEIKQEIDRSKSQTRNARAVINDINSSHDGHHDDLARCHTTRKPPQRSTSN